MSRKKSNKRPQDVSRVASRLEAFKSGDKPIPTAEKAAANIIELADIIDAAALRGDIGRVRRCCAIMRASASGAYELATSNAILPEVEPS